MEKKKILLTDLDPNTGQVEGLPANPREWLKRDVRSLADSMRDTPELVEARGLIVYPYAGRYVIIGGNMRYEAAKLLHWKDIDCVVLPEDTTSGKLKEILLKDNSTFGVWQFKKLKEDFGEFEFQDLGIKFPEMPKGDKKADEDNYNPEKVLNSMREPKTKRGDAYRMGEHILICGDCTDVKVLERLFSIGGGTEQADLLLTDPPYNVNYDRKIMNDNMADAAFRTFLTDAFSAAFVVCKDGAAAYIWMASTEIDSCIESYEAAGWLYKQMLIWVKNTFTLGRQDYQWQHENCVYGWKPGDGHYFSESRKNSTVYDGQKPIEQMNLNECRLMLKQIFDENGIPTTVLRYNKPNSSAEHPTMKPVQMIGEQIKNSTRKGGIVLDIFSGSGTTLIACEQLGRRCRAVELDEKYCDVIVDRWQKLTGKKAIKI